MKKLIMFALALASSGAFAERQTALIGGFVPYSKDSAEVMIFKLQGNVVAGCNTAGRFVISSADKKYKATVSAVMAAFFANKPVTVEYLPSCNVISNSADVAHICVGTINC